MNDNSNKKRQYTLAFTLIGIILVIDQLVKFLVKTNMHLGEEISLIGDWCLLHFTENEGFAFGMQIGGEAGKIILSIFRIIASGGLLWFLMHLIKKGSRTSLVVCCSLIFVGALGNVIDSCFYGMIFNESLYNVARLFPEGGGYAPFLQGRVVDMFYLPVIDTYWPDWMPLWGGKHFIFFNAIFNVADAAITIGAIWLIIDQIFLAPKDPDKEATAIETD